MVFRHCLIYQKMRNGFLRKETLHLREGCLLYVLVFASNKKVRLLCVMLSACACMRA